MKTSHLKYLLTTLAAVSFASCESETPEQDNPGTNEPEIPVDPPKKENPAPGTYNFVLPQTGGKTVWAEGDEIYLTGGYTPHSMTVKVSASDISEDGRTASVRLSSVPESVFGPDDFYAAWPAGLVSQDDTFCEDVFSFTATDAPLLGAWLEDNTFRFENLCGVISLSVDGDWDEAVLRSNKWEYVLFDNFSAKVNSESPDYLYSRKSGHYFFNKALQDGRVSFFIAGELSLGEGFTIHLRKGDGYPKAYLHPEPLTLSRNDVLDLGDITGKLSDYDGPAPADPEMPVMGSYTKYSIPAIPELSGLCLNADKTALWGVGDNGLLGIIEFDGTVSKTWKPAKSCGMEDISINPQTGELFIADEDYHRVVSVAASDYTGNTESKMPFTELFKIQAAISGGYGNSSVEGVAYYKDDILFVGTQVGANLWKYTTGGEELSMVSLRKLTSNAITEIGGLCYDPVRSWLWVIDSETQKIYVLDEDITHILASYPVRFAGNSESVCVDHGNGCVWVGDDSDSTSKLFRIEFEGL